MDLLKYSPTTEFLLYKFHNGNIEVDVLSNTEAICMFDKKIADILSTQGSAITKYLRSIFKTKELDKKVVCSILELPTQHGAIKG